jgi:hypothetical protein
MSNGDGTRLDFKPDWIPILLKTPKLKVLKTQRIDFRINQRFHQKL